MSTPQLPGSKGKIAAFILFGVAAVALVFGIVSLSTGGGGDEQASGNTAGTQAPTTPGAPGKSTPGSTPTMTSPASPKPSATTPPATPVPPGKTTTVIQPPGAGGDQPQPAGQPVGDKAADVRVYNNGTIKHLATQAADRLRRDGYHVVSVANYPQGVIPTTTVYYRPGSNEQATATSLANDIGARAEPRFPGLASASPGVIVIITNDYKG